MSTAHKLPDEWLLSYGAGALNFGRSLMVASQVAYHDDLKETVAQAESIGGALLESLRGSDLDHSILERVMDRLDSRDVPLPETPGGNGGLLPEPLAEFVGTDIDSLHWRFMAPGMKSARLWDGANDERLWLLRARGGIEVPEHGHNGDEWTLVLKGAFATPDGHFAVGDMDIADESVVHQPVIDRDEECICLVLTQKPLAMKGPIARMMQPFIGL